MIPFYITYREYVESGQYLVRTRDGRPVQILKWNRKHSKLPILALITNPEGDEEILCASADGIHRTDPKKDLVLVTPDEEDTIRDEAVRLRLLERNKHSLSLIPNKEDLLAKMLAEEIAWLEKPKATLASGDEVHLKSAIALLRHPAVIGNKDNNAIRLATIDWLERFLARFLQKEKK